MNEYDEWAWNHLNEEEEEQDFDITLMKKSKYHSRIAVIHVPYSIHSGAEETDDTLDLACYKSELEQLWHLIGKTLLEMEKEENVHEG